MVNAHLEYDEDDEHLNVDMAQSLTQSMVAGHIAQTIWAKALSVFLGDKSKAFAFVFKARSDMTMRMEVEEGVFSTTPVPPIVFATTPKKLRKVLRVLDEISSDQLS